MHKLRILILYPDPAGLALLTSMLKSLGHIIEEATNDRVAVKLMERNNIDLVLAGVDPARRRGTGALDLRAAQASRGPCHPVVSASPPRAGQGGAAAGRDGGSQVSGSGGRAAGRRAASPRAVRGAGPAEPAPAAPPAPQTGRPIGRHLSPPCQPATPRPPKRFVRPRARRHVRPISSAPTPPPAIVTGRGHGRLHARRGPATQRVDLLAREIGLIGTDPSWRQVIELAATIAATRTSVLIVGEPGTGKSLLARLIHALGPNPDRPFITVESSAMADEIRGQDRRTGRAPYSARRIDPHDLGQQAGPGPRRHALPRRSRPCCPSSSSITCSASCISATTRRAPAIPTPPARPVRHVHQRKPTRPDRAGAVPPGALSPHQRDQPHAPPASAPRDRRRAPGRVVPGPVRSANFTKTSRASPAMPSTSCKSTTGRATSASSRPPSSGPSPCAAAPGSPRATWPRSSTITSQADASAQPRPGPTCRWGSDR